MYDPTHSYLGLDVDFSGSVILRKTDYVMTFSSYTLKVSANVFPQHYQSSKAKGETRSCPISAM